MYTGKHPLNQEGINAYANYLDLKKSGRMSYMTDFLAAAVFTYCFSRERSLVESLKDFDKIRKMDDAKIYNFIQYEFPKFLKTNPTIGEKFAVRFDGSGGGIGVALISEPIEFEDVQDLKYYPAKRKKIREKYENKASIVLEALTGGQTKRGRNRSS